MEEIALTEEYPALLSQKLIAGSIDLGLVPVATIPHLAEWHLVGDYGIGCDGPVASVCLFSEVPMEEITTVYLDYQSRTSVLLLKLLLKEYWKKEVTFLVAQNEDYRRHITGSTAGLVIGDRALEQAAHAAYTFDLGAAWKEHTGLPFVFAAWISNRQLAADFVSRFNEANAQGLERMEEVVGSDAPAAIRKYFTENIHYKLTSKMKEGFHAFLQKIHSL